jgi:hypothetical protein
LHLRVAGIREVLSQSRCSPCFSLFQPIRQPLTLEAPPRCQNSLHREHRLEQKLWLAADKVRSNAGDSLVLRPVTSFVAA